MTKIREGYKETEIGVIPEDWEVCCLSDVGNFRKGKGIKKDEVIDSGLKCIRYGQIYTDYEHVVYNTKSFISEETANSSMKIEKGEVILAGSGETLEDIGKAITYLGDERCYVGGDTIIFKPNSSVDSLFLSYFLATKEVTAQKRKLGQGNSIVHLYVGGAKQIIVFIPPFQEQQRIAEILSTTDAHIEKLDKTIEDYQLLKKGMMKKLLTEGIGHTEFKETEIGRIPKEWELVSLGKIFSLASGEGLSQKDIIEGDYPVYGGNGINGYHNSYLFDAAMICIGRVGAKCGCVHYTQPKSWITDNALFIKQRKKMFDDCFMLYLLEFLNLNQYANQNAQPVISGSKIYPIEIAFPLYNEQVKIGESIKIIDMRIKLYIEEKKELILLKKSLMEKLLTGKLRVNTFQMEV